MSHRFFVDEKGFQDGWAQLHAEEAKHALRVLRLSAGDEVELLDGQSVYRAVLREPDGSMLRADLREPVPGREPALRITLYQGLPKGEKMDWIVQKATELGAAAIVPVRLSRAVAKPDSKTAARQQQRWQRISREATKQCGRAMVPRVQLPIDLAEVCAQARELDRLLVPWEEAAEGSIAQAMSGHSLHHIGILIGPEGGLSVEEISVLTACGAQTVTLGPRILRTETAALCALTLALGAHGELE